MLVNLLSKLRYSLKYRIAAIIFLLEALLMATVLGVTLSYSMEESRKQQAATEQVMLNLLGDLSRTALLTAEYDELQPYLEKVVSDPSVSAALLADRNNKVVVSTHYTYLGRQLPHFIDDETRHWRSFEVRNSTGKLGTLAIQFTEEDLITTNHQVMNMGITIALIGMISIAVFGILIGFLLTRRLETLADSAKQLASGNLSARTNFNGYDEVSVVGQTFDQMATNVSENMTALQKATDLLEQRVKERTEELAIARDEAVNANRSKSDFLANMSHEIRTPLTAIIGYSESMQDSDLPPAEQTESLNTVIRSSRHLLQIINDILDLSKIEASKMEIETIPVSPFELLHDVQSLVNHMASNKGLNFKIDYSLPLPEVIYSDPVRLKQILINLVNNAIKFTQQGSVRIIVDCDTEMERIHFKVIDTGIGMNQDQLAGLFQPFVQANNAITRKFGGTGLGLHLSRQLAEKLGGDITTESTVNVGSCFELVIRTGSLRDIKLLHTIPEHCEIENIDQHKLVNSKLTGHVLLAEDNPDNQRLISMLIRQTGAEVDIAENGRQAVNMALAKSYDLILMDMQMPIVGGLEATKTLRKHGYQKPIFALTANAMQDELKQCKQAGCDGHLTKPIDRNMFRETLYNYLMSDKNCDSTEPPIISPIIENDPDLVEILEIFIQRLPGMLTNICEAYENRHYDDLKHLIHDLKGTCGNFGYDCLYELSLDIESDLMNKNFNRISEKLQAVEKLTQRILLGFNKRPAKLSVLKNNSNGPL